MKKLFILLSIILCFLFPLCKNNVYAINKVYFGRATNIETYLYSTPKVEDDYSNVLFEIPTTYFVELLGEENEFFYKAVYNGISGYVLKSEMSCIDTTPKQPFATNITFRIFTPSGVNLRSSPIESKGASNLVLSIPFLSTNQLFYGIVHGEEAISYKGDIWYYCKYIKDNQEYFGYVYSPLCDLLTQIEYNTEEFTYITPTFNTKVEKINDEEEYLDISKPWQIIIIFVVCLPCVVLIYMLFKPTKIAMQKSQSIKPKKTKRKKKKISHLKHSDYYELDSDYFN